MAKKSIACKDLGSSKRKRLSLRRDQFQEGLLRIGEFLQAFFHQDLLETIEINFGIDLGEYFIGREICHLRGKLSSALENGLIGCGGIRLDIASREGGDVLPSRILELLRSRAGEDDLLVQRQVLVFPIRDIVGPQPLGIDNPNLALGCCRKLRHMLFGIDIQP